MEHKAYGPNGTQGLIGPNGTQGPAGPNQILPANLYYSPGNVVSIVGSFVSGGYSR